MKCNNLIGRALDDGNVYILASDVMEAISELKQKLHDAEEELHNWKAEVTRVRNEKMALFDEMSKKVYNEKMCANLAKAACTEYREDIKKLRSDAEKLIDKIYERNIRDRQTRLALWLARAERANEAHYMWCQLIYDKKYGIVKFNVKKEWGENAKQWQTLRTPQGWAEVWDDVEYKCRKKAEEYK